MPKLPENIPHKVDRTIQNSGPIAVDNRARTLSYNKNTKSVARDQPGVYLQDGDVDLKIKILSASIADNYLPTDFTKNSNITEADLINLADTAYIFVDNNGAPVKILASAVLRTEIGWDNLAEDVKQKILQIVDSNKLIPGENISIDENNVISANIGVKTINGQTGAVSLTAADLNAYTKTETYSKSEVYSKPELQDLIGKIIVDGGRVE